MAPIATTGSAQDLGGGSVNFQGAVNPSGASVSYYVQYTYTQSCGGAQTASGSTPPQTIAAGTFGNVSVTAQAQVGAGQTISYQLIATDDAGSSTGTTAQVTLAGGSGHDSQSVTSVTASSAQLNVFLSGYSSPLASPAGIPGAGGPTVAPAIGFEYGPTSTYGSRTDVVQWWSLPCPVSHSETVSGLQPGSTYHYAAVDGAWTGTPHYGDDFKCQTTVADPFNGLQTQPCPIEASLPDATFTTAAGSSGGGIVVLGNGGGTVGTTVACQASQSCTGSLRLTTTIGAAGDGSIARVHRIVLGQARFRLRPHRSALVRIRLNATGRRMLRQGRLQRVTETLRIHAGHGRAVTTTRTVRVTRQRH